jgi:hypothetical protein
MPNKINWVRQEIVQAFSGLEPPAPSDLINPYENYLSRFYDPAKTAESAGVFRDQIAGKHWSDLNYEYLITQANWAAFSYLSAEGYRYYLPALLVLALDYLTVPDTVEGHPLFTILWELRPEWRDLYYDNKRHFTYQTSQFSPAQYRAVCSFLELVFDSLDFHRFAAAQALKWGWNRHEHPALSKITAYFHQLHHYEYPIAADPQIAALVEQIKAAFAEVPYPGDENICLRPDYESAEYVLEFRGLNWKILHPAFLRKQLGALSFLTPAAHRYFLPAYLIADIMVWHSDTPVLELTNKFQHEPAEEAEIEPLLAKSRSTGLTEAEYHRMAHYFGAERFAPFSQAERKAIIAYLRYKASTEEYDEKDVERALQQYWLNTID